MSKQTKKNVKMINVADKKVTKRIAVAEAFVNLNTSTKEKIYKDKIIKGDVISESGIKTIEDMIDLWSYGIKGFLIGETLLKNPSKLKDFLNVKTN